MDLQHLRASDGTGEAVLAHVSSPRTIGSTVLELDNVDNWNTKCIVVTGTPNANGFISAAGMKVMYGHLSAGDFIIDGYAPGYVDNGNTTAEVAIVKMTTSWADALIDILEVAHNDDGTIKNDAISSQNMFTDALDPVTRLDETTFDFVASGIVWTGDSYGSTRAASMTAGVVYINGKRVPVSAVTARAFTASKDTYIDVGEDGVLDYTEVANNAASPALAADHIRIGIIVTGASSIANVGSVNQGEINKVLPIASSIPYAVTDSLGNLICSRDPRRKVLGFRQQIATQAINATGPTDVTGLSMPIIVPTGRKVKLISKLNLISVGGAHFGQTIIREGATSVGIQATWIGGTSNAFSSTAETTLEPSAGLHTYKTMVAFGTTSNSAYADTNGFNAFIMAILE